MKRNRILILILLGTALAAVGFVIHFFVQENRQWELSRAAGDGDLDTVKRCVEAGVNLDATPIREGGALSGYPALTCAAMFGREEVVRYLLDHGANPNLRGMSNPLIVACWRKHFGVAKLLLERGADPNARGEGTPLVAARSQPELSALLRQHGARD